jgi:hypothetical protein
MDVRGDQAALRQGDFEMGADRPVLGGLEAQYAVVVPMPGAFYGGLHFHLVRSAWVEVFAGLRQRRRRAVEGDEQRIGLAGRLALVTGEPVGCYGEGRFDGAWAIFVPTPAGVGRGQQEHRGAGGYCGLAGCCRARATVACAPWRIRAAVHLAQGGACQSTSPRSARAAAPLARWMA